MGVVSLLVMAALAMGTVAYLPGKDHLMSESLLREVVERMGRDLDSYLEEVGGGIVRPEGEDSYYQDNPPAIRDQEYLQHSSLWANRYMQQGGGMAGGSGGEERVKPAGGGQKGAQLKPDTALPAYCNPPNPCPIGYTSSQGCLEDFENTAAFSREYQAQQECMCDSEHMFDCSNTPESDEINELDRLVHQFQVEDEHKNLVAKKFHVKKDWNPYLLGEKLPVAAKKGQNVIY